MKLDLCILIVGTQLTLGRKEGGVQQMNGACKLPCTSILNSFDETWFVHTC